MNRATLAGVLPAAVGLRQEKSTFNLLALLVEINSF